MKASLKFRDDQKPLARAKIPLSVLGIPFLSGIAGSDSKELILSLATAFDSGPDLKLSYRPNDSWNPFSITVKSGIGSFGSMSAEFSVLGHGNPNFSLLFKPQIGDFSIKKTAGSAISLPSEPAVFFKKVKVIGKDPDADVEVPIENGIYSAKERNGFQPSLRSGVTTKSLLSGAELTSRSILPLGSLAQIKFRWGVKIPGDIFHEEESCLHHPDGISSWKAPMLIMNKISIEQMSVKSKDAEAKVPTAVPEGDGACLSIGHRLDALQSDTGLLRKAMEELRSEIGTSKGWRDGGWKSGAGKKNDIHAPVVGVCAGTAATDVASELKKALVEGRSTAEI